MHNARQHADDLAPTGPLPTGMSVDEFIVWPGGWTITSTPLETGASP